MRAARFILPPRGPQRSRAFTLIELLVVFAVIAVLISSVLVAGSSLITKARTRNTQAVLQIVREAVDEFKRESPSIITARQPGISGTVRYRERYGSYPPDETEMFTAEGLPGCTGPPCRSLAVGAAEFVPAPRAGTGYAPMRFYTAGNASADLEHRDLVAMVIAIEMYTTSAAEILDRIPDSNRSPGILDPNGNPRQFLDRDEVRNGTWDADVDLSVRYIVDDWGVPISYFAQQDYDPDAASDTVSSNAPGWNQAATEMIRLNGGQPIIMSYGPNGREQLTRDVQTESEGAASPAGDWVDGADYQRIGDSYNADNVYADPALGEKLAKGVSGP